MSTDVKVSGFPIIVQCIQTYMLAYLHVGGCDKYVGCVRAIQW